MPTILRKISVLVYQKNQTICKLKSNHVFFYNFGVDDFAFMGIVFLFLVVFGKQPFPALVGGRRNG